jgi:hypothetical protein
MLKNGSEPTRRNAKVIAFGSLLEACQETTKAEKVWKQISLRDQLSAGLVSIIKIRLCPFPNDGHPVSVTFWATWGPEGISTGKEKAITVRAPNRSPRARVGLSKKFSGRRGNNLTKC